MEGFKHYITTRFNLGLYSPGSEIKVSTDEWMWHRIGLFKKFALPSIMGQTCQNFTWLVLLDRRTPDDFKQKLENIGYENIKFIYSNPPNKPWLDNIEQGQYELITTRVDNDDALHRDTIKTVQNRWRQQRHTQKKPWVMVFPYGYILDLLSRQIFVMEYWLNNCPTAVEDSTCARTIWQWEHCCIPRQVSKNYIKDKPYWLQVIHSQNLRNVMPIDHPNKIIRRDIPARIEALANFNVDIEKLPSE